MVSLDFLRLILGFPLLPNWNDLQLWVPNCLANLENLRELHLTDSQLNGTIGNLSMFHVLDVSRNQLSGMLPENIGNLSMLHELDVSYNNLRGMVTVAVFARLVNLESLNLSRNLFVLNFPPWIKTQWRLQYLDLRNASISGTLPSWFCDISCHITKLIRHATAVDLSSNLFKGPIPILPIEWDTLGNLSMLREVYVFDNNLRRMVAEAIFARLVNFETLYLSHNLLVLNVSHDWVPPFQLYHLVLGSLPLRTGFPPWIKTQWILQYLDLCNASISGILPSWFCDISFHIIQPDRSNNGIQGQSSSNLFKGPIPVLVPEVMDLNLSNNQLFGYIPANIGQIMFNL
ncbi:hypothetical protein AMTRI_Chr05g69650 [Amborella trichopoda]